LDEQRLLGGQLDFRENPSSIFGFSGFDLGMGSLRFSDDTRQLCAQMVAADERSRLTADSALRQPLLWKLCPRGPTTPKREATATPTGSQSLPTGHLRPVNMQGQSGSAPSKQQTMLAPGTRCRYFSNNHGWVLATVQAYNPQTGTYDLDVKPQVMPDKISPVGETLADAWPPGTQVVYLSSSTSKWLPTVVRSFNEQDGTYNLDVRDHASIDRIRVRDLAHSVDSRVDDGASTSAGSSGASAPAPVAELRVSDLVPRGQPQQHQQRHEQQGCGGVGGLQRSPAMSDRLQYGYHTLAPLR